MATRRQMSSKGPVLNTGTYIFTTTNRRCAILSHLAIAASVVAAMQSLRIATNETVARRTTPALFQRPPDWTDKLEKKQKDAIVRYCKIDWKSSIKAFIMHYNGEIEKWYQNRISFLSLENNSCNYLVYITPAWPSLGEIIPSVSAKTELDSFFI